jgi:2-oxoglutarate dehydrogenase E2 component (dihydrolipoamide succinyltransferase)
MPIVEMKVPTIGESINEVTLSQWLKADGSYVEMDEAICEFESDKATLEFPAEISGKLIHVASEGDDLEIGALVARIDTSVKAANSEPSISTESPSIPEVESVQKMPEKADSVAKGHPSPAAAKILREADLDPKTLAGTGKAGRITKADAVKASAEQPVTPAKEIEDTQDVSQGVTQTGARNVRREKMSRMRRTIARRLVAAKNDTAMLTTFNEADMSAIMRIRKTYQEKFVEKYGIKLGFMSFFAKASAKVLMEMPAVNGQIDGNELIYHDFVDISIAISTPNGLVVPPLRNVESMHFAQIEHGIKDLAEKARNGKLTLEEMSGGTFTITNGGIFGSMMSTPIINEPQSAILGMHTIMERPVAVDGAVEVRPMMYLALSYDHRVIDGSTSVTFLVKVKELLEDPMKLMLDI